jgi:phosphopantetheine--protein transferase-like protein
MMTVAGIGIDIVDVAQMRGLLEGSAGAAFIAKTFTSAEIGYAAGNPERFASLFGAKEATFKAFRTGWIDGQCVETAHEDSGAPNIILHGDLRSLADERGIAELWVSLSTTEHCAVAVVIISREIE